MFKNSSFTIWNLTENEESQLSYSPNFFLFCLFSFNITNPAVL